MDENINSLLVPHPIIGKVAQIINGRELAINIGSEQGVTEGMKFKILTDIPLEVTDPDTGETLGSVDREKVKVKVSEVFDKFSICTTYRKIEGPYGNTIASLYEYISKDLTRIETLKASDKSFPPPLTESESYVKVGDRAIEIIDVA